MEHQRIIEGTLDWCNEKRMQGGLELLDELPKGRKDDGYSCPCGAATQLYVGNTTYGDEEENCNYPLPEVVEEFVALFDRGILPQFDIALED